MNYPGPCTAVIVGMLYSCSISAAGLTGADLRFINDSNPAKAEFDRDIEATSSIRGRVTANLYDRTISEDDMLNSGFSINGSASFEHNTDIEALGESRYRVGATWFREKKQSAGMPFVRLGLGLNYFFDTTLGVQAVVSDAETKVFDTSKATLFTTANFSPTPKLVLRTGLRYVIGDEVSTATPTTNIVNNAEIIEPDEAFGGAPDGRFAYLIGANSAIAEAGFGYSVTGSIEANMMYRFVSTQADGDISYERSIVEFILGIDL